MTSPFYVAPPSLGGLGQIAQAWGQQRQQEQQQAKMAEQQAAQKQQIAQAFSLMRQAARTQDPVEREQLSNQAFQLAPNEIMGFQKFLNTQREGEQIGQTEAMKDGRTSTQKEYAQYQSLKKSDPVAAIEFGRAAGFVDELGQELSVHLQKRLSDSTDMAIESRSNVAEFENLADQIQNANIGGGIFQGSWAERVKDLTGQQDAVTSLRKRYNAIKGSQVVKNLPPGAASDADIALALAGFPTDNASGPQLASFLRGVAKLEERQADFQDFKANYISENRTERGMLKAYKEQQKKAETPEVEQEIVLNGDNIVMTHPQYGEITEADIEQTMKANNLTREQVMQRLGGK